MLMVEYDIKPVKRLWGQVMMQAIDDAWGPKLIHKEFARRWIQAKDPRPCGFAWVCSLFELDPHRTAELILADQVLSIDLRKRAMAQTKMRRQQTEEY